MLGEILFGMLLAAFGALYLVFAFRPPPQAIAHFFRIPAVFVFFPEHNRQQLGRITAGAFLLLGGGVMIGRQLYHLVFGWS